MFGAVVVRVVAFDILDAVFAEVGGYQPFLIGVDALHVARGHRERHVAEALAVFQPGIHRVVHGERGAAAACQTAGRAQDVIEQFVVVTAAVGGDGRFHGGAALGRKAVDAVHVVGESGVAVVRGRERDDLLGIRGFERAVLEQDDAVYRIGLSRVLARAVGQRVIGDEQSVSARVRMSLSSCVRADPK